MTEKWEVEYPGIQLHGHEIVWTMKNASQEPAHAHSQVGEISIWLHPDPHSPDLQSTPWTNPLIIDRDVPAETAHTMTYPVQWTGQQQGMYTAKITLGPEVSAEIYFRVTEWGIAPGYE